MGVIHSKDAIGETEFLRNTQALESQIVQVPSELLGTQNEKMFFPIKPLHQQTDSRAKSVNQIHHCERFMRRSNQP
jgi:hypothetical protein